MGIQLFLEGKTVVYHGVIFWKDGERSLHVSSDSSRNIENTDQQIAIEAITRAKAVLIELAEKSSEFAEITERLPHEHYFCYDSGMSVVALARELNGEFTWLV